MLEGKWLEIKGKLLTYTLKVVGNAPLVGKAFKLPFTAAFGRPVVVAVIIFSAGMLMVALPDNLRIGSYENIIAPSLKLLTVSGIKNFIIFPITCYVHNSPRLLSCLH